jgi:hypothetical protein
MMDLSYGPWTQCKLCGCPRAFTPPEGSTCQFECLLVSAGVHGALDDRCTAAACHVLTILVRAGLMDWTDPRVSHLWSLC